MRRPTSSSRLLLLALAAALTASGCGGDEVFPREDFVKQVSANGLAAPVAECAYDQIKDNETIMKELVRTGGPNDSISEKVSGELTPILARCLVAYEDEKSGTTTTTPTTKKSSSSDRTTTTRKK